MTSFSIFNWRILIFKTDINYHAKYLACYLSTYMNEHGDNCFPSIKRISHESGVSEPTVCKYIQVLREEGWLETKKKGFDGQAWAHNQYYPNIPEKALNDIKRLFEGTKPHKERHLTSEGKALKEVNTSSSVNSTESSSDNSQSPNKQVNGVPYQKIIDLYHNKLPNNPQVAMLSANRKALIKARWNNGLPDMEAWEEYFDYVCESDFLTGKVQPTNGRRVFIANIDFLIKEANVLKIFEGNYSD